MYLFLKKTIRGVIPDPDSFGSENEMMTIWFHLQPNESECSDARLEDLKIISKLHGIELVLNDQIINR